MAFQRFAAAPVRVSYADAVKAWVKVLKDGRRSLNITLSGVLASNWPALDAMAVGNGDAWAEVFIGDGEDAGQLELHFGYGPGRSVDAVEVRGGVHGLRRLTMAVPPEIPEGECVPAACEIVSRNDTEIRLRLPIAEWTRPSRPVTRPAPAPGGKREPKIDAAAYLRKKLSLNISVDEHGEFRVGDRPVERAEVLRQVNTERKKAALPELTLADI